MKSTEWELRAIRDRIAAAMGEVEEASAAAEMKSNRTRLAAAAEELHRCADGVHKILMRVKPR